MCMYQNPTCRTDSLETFVVEGILSGASSDRVRKRFTQRFTLLHLSPIDKEQPQSTRNFGVSLILTFLWNEKRAIGSSMRELGLFIRNTFCFSEGLVVFQWCSPEGRTDDSVNDLNHFCHLANPDYASRRRTFGIFVSRAQVDESRFEHIRQKAYLSSVKVSYWAWWTWKNCGFNRWLVGWSVGWLTVNQGIFFEPLPDLGWRSFVSVRTTGLPFFLFRDPLLVLSGFQQGALV